MEKNVEKEVIKLSLLDGRLQELEQQIVLLEKQVNELELCKLALEELKKTKKDSEMLVPLSSGVFVKARLADNEEVIINIGAKIFCKKNLAEAKEFIQKKLDEVMGIYNKIISEMNSIVEAIRFLEKEILKKQKSK